MFFVIYVTIILGFSVLYLLGLAGSFTPRQRQPRYNYSRHQRYYPQGARGYYAPYYRQGPAGWEVWYLWEQDDPDAPWDFSDRD